MVLPILISVSVTPGPYFFCAKAGKAGSAASVESVAANAVRRLSTRVMRRVSLFPFLFL